MKVEHWSIVTVLGTIHYRSFLGRVGQAYDLPYRADQDLSNKLNAGEGEKRRENENG